LKTEVRSKLFYGKYPYKASLQIVGCSYTYFINNYDEFTRRMEKYKLERARYKSTWLNTIELTDFSVIEKYLDWRNKNKDYVTIRLEGDRVSVFSNDLDLLKTLEKLGSSVEYTQAIALQADTLYFKSKPKYKFRTFFKGKRIPTAFPSLVLDFNNRYGNKPDINISPALINMLNNRSITAFSYLHGSYYIEYNTESTLSLIHMMFDDMVGKTYKLEKRP
jgi:hypothetical protein